MLQLGLSLETSVTPDSVVVEKDTYLSSWEILAKGTCFIVAGSLSISSLDLSVISEPTEGFCTCTCTFKYLLAHFAFLLKE